MLKKDNFFNHCFARSKEYKKNPQITKDRLYIETMKEVLSKVPNKIIIDASLENFLPLLNLQQKGK